jgi:hypothetical protein
VSNTILTPTAVTREALRILHQKLTFVSKISRSYDDSYAKEGAKIGDTLKIRLPNRYSVTTGRVMTAQDTTESSVSLQVATQKHVGMNFTTNELTLSLDDFSERITDASNCTVNGASQTGSTITITNGSSKTFAVGDVVTFAGCNRVHPESKTDTGSLHQFVVTAAVTAGGTSLSISPAITTSGASQNCSASPTSGGAITKIGGASAVYKPSVIFQKEAFALATADLIMPKGVDFGAREVMDGISMRIVRQYDINNDALPCRVDVLYGYKTVRPQLAARILSN